MLFMDYLMINVFGEKTLSASFASLFFLIAITNFDKIKIKNKILLYSAVMVVAAISSFQISVKLNSEDVQRLINLGYVNQAVFNNVISIVKDEENFNYKDGLTYSVIKKAINEERIKEKKKKKVDKINKQKLDFENQFEQIKSEVIKKNNWS